MMDAALTIIILTRDESLHLARCLRAIRGLCARIIVVDSGSTDNTLEIARVHGADVYVRAWVNHADQFQWALDNAAITTDWVMRLDADEVIGQDLLVNLVTAMHAAGKGTVALSVDRRHIFMDRWIRHGGRYPLRLIRVWRPGHGRVEQRWMDEHVVITGGMIEHVPGEFSDINLNDLTFLTAKHNGYATREALDALIASHDLLGSREDDRVRGNMQASRRRIIKEKIYNRLPFGAGPILYFIFRYFFQLGFLDGKPGLIYHGLQGLWYRFLVDAKRLELERAISGCADKSEKVARLSALTGHDIKSFAPQALQHDGSSVP